MLLLFYKLTALRGKRQEEDVFSVIIGYLAAFAFLK